MPEGKLPTIVLGQLSELSEFANISLYYPALCYLVLQKLPKRHFEYLGIDDCIKVEPLRRDGTGFHFTLSRDLNTNLNTTVCISDAELDYLTTSQQPPLQRYRQECLRQEPDERNAVNRVYIPNSHSVCGFPIRHPSYLQNFSSLFIDLALVQFNEAPLAQLANDIKLDLQKRNSLYEKYTYIEDTLKLWESRRSTRRNNARLISVLKNIQEKCVTHSQDSQIFTIIQQTMQWQKQHKGAPWSWRRLRYHFSRTAKKREQIANNTIKACEQALAGKVSTLHVMKSLNETCHSLKKNKDSLKILSNQLLTDLQYRYRKSLEQAFSPAAKHPQHLLSAFYDVGLNTEADVKLLFGEKEMHKLVSETQRKMQNLPLNSPRRETCYAAVSTITNVADMTHEGLCSLKRETENKELEDHLAERIAAGLSSKSGAIGDFESVAKRIEQESTNLAHCDTPLRKITKWINLLLSGYITESQRMTMVVNGEKTDRLTEHYVFTQLLESGLLSTVLSAIQDDKERDIYINSLISAFSTWSTNCGEKPITALSRFIANFPSVFFKHKRLHETICLSLLNKIVATGNIDDMKWYLENCKLPTEATIHAQRQIVINALENNPGSSPRLLEIIMKNDRERAIFDELPGIKYKHVTESIGLACFKVIVAEIESLIDSNELDQFDELIANQYIIELLKKHSESLDKNAKKNLLNTLNRYTERRVSRNIENHRFSAIETEILGNNTSIHHIYHLLKADSALVNTVNATILQQVSNIKDSQQYKALFYQPWRLRTAKHHAQLQQQKQNPALKQQFSRQHPEFYRKISSAMQLFERGHGQEFLSMLNAELAADIYAFCTQEQIEKIKNQIQKIIALSTLLSTEAIAHLNDFAEMPLKEYLSKNFFKHSVPSALEEISCREAAIFFMHDIDSYNIYALGHLLRALDIFTDNLEPSFVNRVNIGIYEEYQTQKTMRGTSAHHLEIYASIYIATATWEALSNEFSLMIYALQEPDIDKFTSLCRQAELAIQTITEHFAELPELKSSVDKQWYGFIKLLKTLIMKNIENTTKMSLLSALFPLVKAFPEHLTSHEMFIQHLDNPELVIQFTKFHENLQFFLAGSISDDISHITNEETKFIFDENLIKNFKHLVDESRIDQISKKIRDRIQSLKDQFEHQVLIPILENFLQAIHHEDITFDAQKHLPINQFSMLTHPTDIRLYILLGKDDAVKYALRSWLLLDEAAAISCIRNIDISHFQLPSNIKLSAANHHKVASMIDKLIKHDVEDYALAMFLAKLFDVKQVKAKTKQAHIATMEKNSDGQLVETEASLLARGQKVKTSNGRRHSFSYLTKIQQRKHANTTIKECITCLKSNNYSQDAKPIQAYLSLQNSEVDKGDLELQNQLEALVFYKLLAFLESQQPEIKCTEISFYKQLNCLQQLSKSSIKFDMRLNELKPMIAEKLMHAIELFNANMQQTSSCLIATRRILPSKTKILENYAPLHGAIAWILTFTDEKTKQHCLEQIQTTYYRYLKRGTDIEVGCITRNTASDDETPWFNFEAVSLLAAYLAPESVRYSSKNQHFPFYTACKSALMTMPGEQLLKNEITTLTNALFSALMPSLSNSLPESLMQKLDAMLFHIDRDRELNAYDLYEQAINDSVVEADGLTNSIIELIDNVRLATLMLNESNQEHSITSIESVIEIICNHIMQAIANSASHQLKNTLTEISAEFAELQDKLIFFRENPLKDASIEKIITARSDYILSTLGMIATLEIPSIKRIARDINFLYAAYDANLSDGLSAFQDAVLSKIQSLITAYINGKHECYQQIEALSTTPEFSKIICNNSAIKEQCGDIIESRALMASFLHYFGELYKGNIPGRFFYKCEFPGRYFRPSPATLEQLRNLLTEISIDNEIMNEPINWLIATLNTNSIQFDKGALQDFSRHASVYSDLLRLHESTRLFVDDQSASLPSSDALLSFLREASEVVVDDNYPDFLVSTYQLLWQLMQTIAETKDLHTQAYLFKQHRELIEKLINAVGDEDQATLYETLQANSLSLLMINDFAALSTSSNSASLSLNHYTVDDYVYVLHHADRVHREQLINLVNHQYSTLNNIMNQVITATTDLSHEFAVMSASQFHLIKTAYHTLHPTTSNEIEPIFECALAQLKTELSSGTSPKSAYTALNCLTLLDKLAPATIRLTAWMTVALHLLHLQPIHQNAATSSKLRRRSNEVTIAQREIALLKFVSGKNELPIDAKTKYYDTVKIIEASMPKLLEKLLFTSENQSLATENLSHIFSEMQVANDFKQLVNGLLNTALPQRQNQELLTRFSKEQTAHDHNLLGFLKLNQSLPRTAAVMSL